MPTASAGPASRVDEISDAFVDAYAALDPCVATYIGVPGHDHELTDASAEGYSARADLARHTLADLDAATADRDALSDHDRVAATQLRELAGGELRMYDAGLLDHRLNVDFSPAQLIRIIFDLMPTETAEDWEMIRARMGAVPTALTRLRSGLEVAAEDGRCVPRRQVLGTAELCRNWAGSPAAPGFFTGLVDGSGRTDPAFDEVAATADAAYGEFADFLSGQLAAGAPEKDAVGRDVYAAWLKLSTGAELDLDETYAWGWEELDRLLAEQRAVVGRISPGGSLGDAVKALNSDPARRLEGFDALKAWLQETSDRAIAELDGRHFDIPEPVRTLECLIAPPGGNASIYYTGPSEDFSRPGRMWWAPPNGQTSFTTWQETTVVYHEGVPGHHLQIAQTVYRTDRLNRFQRLLSGNDAHQEGWALYAERLMAELGYLDDPGDRLGMLQSQIFRAVRVIIDIGMHLELEIPHGVGFHDGERWTPELGYDFLRLHSTSDEGYLRAEINRYLGVPGNAPAYKLGERQWLRSRAAAKARGGADFDLKAFHRAALDLGVMGLDALNDELERI